MYSGGDHNRGAQTAKHSTDSLEMMLLGHGNDGEPQARHTRTRYIKLYVVIALRRIPYPLQNPGNAISCNHLLVYRICCSHLLRAQDSCYKVDRTSLFRTTLAGVERATASHCRGLRRQIQA